jgi:hypothetical protein
MQKHREILSHPSIALIQQRSVAGTHYHPVPFLDRNAEKFVPYCAANQVYLHE